ncbi:MAG TPA: cell division protein ZapA [Xanthobacteraceae bacterium]|nr:cell division protein ZapA [Xanthobacteraceae bacterium]
MPSVSVLINGRKYNMACEDGQEQHLRGLAEDFDRRIAALKKEMGEIGDMRLAVVAALMLADELFEAKTRLGEIENELAAAKDFGAGAVARAQATQSAVVAALNAASERIELVTKSLNQSFTGAVPMG